MDTIFQTDTNESCSISVNPNNIIIVPRGTPEWSQEHGTTSKNIVPLHIVRTVMGDKNESNSNEIGGEILNSKNIMIVNEDSSEWSCETQLGIPEHVTKMASVGQTNQDFLTDNENQPGLVTTDDNETNPSLTEDSKILQENEEDISNANNAPSRNANKQSKSAPDTKMEHDGNSEKPPDEELLGANLLRCRTCLSIVDPKENIPLFTLQPTGETLKEFLIYLLPQMVSTLCDEDVVCKQCDTSIKFCVEFIDNCLKVETELLSELDDQVPENEEDSEEYETKYRGEESINVTLDHDYLVGQASEIKSEVDDSFIEAEEPQVAENCLSNDDSALISADEFLFECFRCGMTFESENSLDDHAKVEHGIVKDTRESGGQQDRIYYKCNACEVLFATRQAYNTHVQNSHPEMGAQSVKQGTYTCKQCGNKFFYLGDLFEHKRKVHGFLCSICPDRFNTKKDLDEHIQTHPDLYLCEICSKGFKSRKSLANHIRTHVDPSLHLCEECGRNFTSPEELALHMEEGHPAEKFIRQFICEICNGAFTDKRRLNRHKKMSHECTREYLCTICDKNFSSKTSLDSHYRLKHADVKPYQCEHCGEKFARLDYLRRHNNCNDAKQCKKFMKGPRRKFRYTKADGEPIKCKLCGKTFKDVYLLKLHLTTHTNLRRFRCMVCNLTFTTNKNRERHEKIHEDPMSKYRCIVCWKRTQSQEELDYHMMSHEKKYQCHICHESFARVYLLNFHVSEEHADDEDVEKEKQIVFTEGLKEYLLEY